ncbi:hypothetical protein AB3X52_05025 [Nocardioides sp. DS6]|uniref:Preprotein translocase subunit TatA n=1 Tax=Nocardioides eburneus TaxID=3231482 RepID=A0ABV3SWR5_9ACTN
MDAFRLIMTVVVLAAIVVLILLFERRRAKQIERDLKDQVGDPPDREGRRSPRRPPPR